MRSIFMALMLVAIPSVEAMAQVGATASGEATGDGYVPGEEISGTFTADISNTDATHGYDVTMEVTVTDQNGKKVGGASTDVYVSSGGPMLPGTATGTLTCDFTVPTVGYSYEYTMQLILQR